MRLMLTHVTAGIVGTETAPVWPGALPLLVAIIIHLGGRQPTPTSKGRATLKIVKQAVEFASFRASKKLAPFVLCEFADWTIRITGITYHDNFALTYYTNARSAFTGA